MEKLPYKETTVQSCPNEGNQHVYHIFLFFSSDIDTPARYFWPEKSQEDRKFLMEFLSMPTWSLMTGLFFAFFFHLSINFRHVLFVKILFQTFLYL